MLSISRYQPRITITGMSIGQFSFDHNWLCDYFCETFLPRNSLFFREFTKKKKTFRVQPIEFQTYFVRYARFINNKFEWPEFSFSLSILSTAQSTRLFPTFAILMLQQPYGATHLHRCAIYVGTY